MAVTGLGRTETCIVHHDRAAAARCGRCHKPICAECVISTSDGKFCTRECAEKTADFRRTAGRYKKKSRALGKLVRLAIWAVIIVFALGAVNKFVFNGKMRVLGPYLNKLPVLGTSDAPQEPAEAPAPPAAPTE